MIEMGRAIISGMFRNGTALYVPISPGGGQSLSYYQDHGY